MNIPKKLKVGALTYTVAVVKDLEHAGETNNLTLAIKLADAKPEAMALTLMHEIVHCINYEMKETDVEYLAQAFYQVIAENPIIFKEGNRK